MVAVMLENKRPVVSVDGEEGAMDVEIIYAIYSTVKTGGRIYFWIL